MFSKVTSDTQFKTGTVLLYQSPTAERTVFGQVLRLYTSPAGGKKATLDYGAEESEAVSVNELVAKEARIVGGMSELLAFLNSLGPFFTEMSLKASETFRTVRDHMEDAAKRLLDRMGRKL